MRKGITLRDILLFGMFFTLVLDYRREVADSGGLVVVLSLANVCCGLALVMHERVHDRRVLFFLAPLPIFTLASCLIGILRGQDAYAVFAQAIPIGIFTLTTLACAGYPRSEADLRKMVTLMVVSGLVAATWKLVFAFGYYGLNLETVRFQILSGSSMLLFGYAAAALLTGGRRLMWFALAVSLGVVFVSVTRSYIVMFSFSGLVMIMAIPLSRLGRMTSGIVAIVLVLSIGLGALVFFLPQVEERWIGRLFHYQEVGVDLTELSRIAEASGQIEVMKADWIGLTVGFGMLGESRWAGPELAALNSILPGTGSPIGHGYGHNSYVGSIFVGGLLFGLPMLLAVLLPSFWLFFVLRSVWHRLSGDLRFVALFSLCASAGYASFGLLGGTFGDRSMSFYYGCAFGLQILVLFGTYRLGVSTSHEFSLRKPKYEPLVGLVSPVRIGSRTPRVLGEWPRHLDDGDKLTT